MRDASLRLARTFYADARRGASDSADFAVHLDLALVEVEFAMALGEPFPARRSWGTAMELLRASRGVGPWLYGGAAQAGWVSIQVARSCGVAAAGLGPLDEVVAGWARGWPGCGDVDLPRGVLGLGVYGLAHPDPGVREALVGGVLDVVEDRVEHDDRGSFVRLTDTPQHRADGSAGRTPLGVAHGAAGLVSFLASVVGAGLADGRRARSRLAAVTRWLLGLRRDGDGAAGARWVDTGDAPSRLTWCYGDPGIALAMSVAARVTGSEVLARTSRDLTTAALVRPPRDAGVQDGCLCHGAAGLCWFGHRALGATARRGARRGPPALRPAARPGPRPLLPGG